MAIDLKPTEQTKVQKFTFEAFGNKDFVYTTKTNWDEVQMEVRRITGAPSAQVTSHETVEVSPEHYADNCFQKLIAKNRLK